MSQRASDLKGLFGKRHKLRKMDMRFDMWNVKSIVYRAGLLMTVSKEMSGY
jgi:hypothetical protein